MNLLPVVVNLFITLEPKEEVVGLELYSKIAINIKKITIGKSATVSFECLNCIATVKNKSVIIGIIYRPPPTNANGFSNTAFFNEWEDYLNNLMLLKHEILLTGDINFHLDCKTSSSTNNFFQPWTRVVSPSM